MSGRFDSWSPACLTMLPVVRLSNAGDSPVVTKLLIDLAPRAEVASFGVRIHDAFVTILINGFLQKIKPGLFKLAQLNCFTEFCSGACLTQQL